MFPGFRNQFFSKIIKAQQLLVVKVKKQFVAAQCTYCRTPQTSSIIKN